jgi:predicted AAA+ superfamily ATPase
MYKRLINFDIAARQSLFLWGPRQTGKSTLLRLLFPHTLQFDLLNATEFRLLKSRPEALRERCRAVNPAAGPVIIDEVQKIPELLDEVQWNIENLGLRFILSGSSARKLRRAGQNLLGGRAVRRELFPLVSAEIPQFDLAQALSHGLLPRMYPNQDAHELLHAYVADYLKEEVHAEALVRNLPAFARFLEMVALTNGEIMNYTNIAQDVGVSAAAVKDYYTILVDTLLGDFVPAFLLRPKRRVIQTPKFYLFDVGVCGALAGRAQVLPRSEAFGRAFEHFLWQELRAYAQYSGRRFTISYWRTSSQFEVDFVLGKGEVALEVKASEDLANRHLGGLRAFGQEYPHARRIVVAREARKRITADRIEIYPWQQFLEELWSDTLMQSQKE